MPLPVRFKQSRSESQRETSAYRSLGAAVLRQAILEAHGVMTRGDRPLTPENREEALEDAKDFLDPENPDFIFWCEAADLDPEELHEAIQKNGAAFVRMAREGRTQHIA